jgi:hypothetical protein
MIVTLMLAVHVVVSFASRGVDARAEGGSKPRRLIYYGWGTPDTRYVRTHWSDMERMPFDGTGITVMIDRSGSDTSTHNQLGWQLMGRREFSREEFAGATEDLRAARWQRFHENFLPVVLSPEAADGLTWFDDDRWRTIVRNLAVVSWVANEGGLKGVILDPEHYGYAMFSYSEHRRRTGRTFEDTRDAARKRGRELIGALRESLPRVVVLSLFGHTLALHEMQHGKSLQTTDYALLPAFLDGVLDGIGEEGTYVDGFEFAYGYKKREQFVEGYRRIHGAARALSEVQDQYRRKVRAGFGIRLDHYDRLDYFTPEELRRSLQAALEVSDGYVWLYSQQARFFPPVGVSSEQLEAIRDARDSARR